MMQQFLDTFVAKIFGNFGNSTISLELMDQLMQLKSGRYLFLQSFQKYVSGQDGSSCSVGSISSFQHLIIVFKLFLRRINSSCDFSLAKALLLLATKIYYLHSGIPLFVKDFLIDEEIWKNDIFWETYFFETLEEESREKIDDEQKIFKTLGSCVNQMLGLRIAEKTTIHFVDDYSLLCRLHEEKRTTLFDLVKNLERANKSSNIALSLKSSKRDNTLQTLDEAIKAVNFPKVKNSIDESELSKELFAKLLEINKNNKPLTLSSRILEYIPSSSDSPRGMHQITVEKSEKGHILTLNTHKVGVQCLEWIKVGSRGIFASGDSEGNICLHSGSGKFVGNLTGHVDRISCMASSKANVQSPWLASGSYDTHVILWDAINQKQIFKKTDHKAPILCLNFDSNIIASGSEDATIRLFDARSGKTEAVLSQAEGGHSQAVSTMALCTSRNVLISGGKDNLVLHWDLRTQRARNVCRHNDWVKHVFFDESMDCVVSSSFDGSARVFAGVTTTGDLPYLESYELWDPYYAPVTCFKAFLRANESDSQSLALIVGTSRGEVRVWDPTSKFQTKSFKVHNDEVCFSYVFFNCFCR